VADVKKILIIRILSYMESTSARNSLGFGHVCQDVCQGSADGSADPCRRPKTQGSAPRRNVGEHRSGGTVKLMHCICVIYVKDGKRSEVV